MPARGPARPIVCPGFRYGRAARPASNHMGHKGRLGCTCDAAATWTGSVKSPPAGRRPLCIYRCRAGGREAKCRQLPSHILVRECAYR